MKIKITKEQRYEALALIGALGDNEIHLVNDEIYVTIEGNVIIIDYDWNSVYKRIIYDVKLDTIISHEIDYCISFESNISNMDGVKILRLIRGLITLRPSSDDLKKALASAGLSSEFKLTPNYLFGYDVKSKVSEEEEWDDRCFSDFLDRILEEWFYPFI